MELFEQLTAKARKYPQHIVLPEGLETRTLTAADRILGDGLAKITLIGNPDEIKALARDLRLMNIETKANFVDPPTNLSSTSMPNFYTSSARVKA